MGADTCQRGRDAHPQLDGVLVACSSPLQGRASAGSPYHPDAGHSCRCKLRREPWLNVACRQTGQALRSIDRRRARPIFRHCEQRAVMDESTPGTALPHSTCQRRGLELYQTQQSTSLTQTARRGLGGACIRCESLETHLADADNEVSGQVHTGLERTDKLHEELSFAMCEQGDSLNCVTIPAMHAQR